MKNFKKWIGVAILVAVIGLLIFGAVNRTKAQTATEGNDSHLELSESSGAEISEGQLAASVETVTSTASPVANEMTVMSGTDNGMMESDRDALLYMYEEEKMARDVYTFLAKQWGYQVFNNISASEQTHMDAVMDLIIGYGLEGEVSSEAGRFNNETLQNLYTQLTTQGSLSVEEAFKAGAAIEEIDILDLRERLASTKDSEIQTVFNNLLNGSYNHLSAFTANLQNRTGMVYEPQYLSVEEYQAILSQADTNGGAGYGIGGGNRGENQE